MLTTTTAPLTIQFFAINALLLSERKGTFSQFNRQIQGWKDGKALRLIHWFGESVKISEWIMEFYALENPFLL